MPMPKGLEWMEWSPFDPRRPANAPGMTMEQKKAWMWVEAAAHANAYRLMEKVRGPGWDIYMSPEKQEQYNRARELGHKKAIEEHWQMWADDYGIDKIPPEAMQFVDVERAKRFEETRRRAWDNAAKELKEEMRKAKEEGREYDPFMEHIKRQVEHEKWMKERMEDIDRRYKNGELQI